MSPAEHAAKIREAVDALNVAVFDACDDAIFVDLNIEVTTVEDRPMPYRPHVTVKMSVGL